MKAELGSVKGRLSDLQGEYEDKINTNTKECNNNNNQQQQQPYHVLSHGINSIIIIIIIMI